MADAAEEITIQFDDDGKGKIVEDGAAASAAGAADGGAAAEGAAVITDDPAAGIDDLKRQVEQANVSARDANTRAANESRGRQDAERRAAEANEQARIARVSAGDSQYDSIVNALSASEREMDNLQVAKATALESGNYTEVAKLDVAMAKNGARQVQLESGKVAIEEQRKQIAAQPKQAAPVYQPVNDQEKILAGLPARSADWIRQNPRYFTDPTFQKQVLGAATYAENNKGLDPDSDEYFRFIESEVGLRAAPVAAPTSKAAEAVQERVSTPARAAPPIAAAPSRSVPIDNPQTLLKSSGTVRLGPEERAMAHSLHPRRSENDPDPEVVYARNKAALMREGRHDGSIR